MHYQRSSSFFYKIVNQVQSVNIQFDPIISCWGYKPLIFFFNGGGAISCLHLGLHSCSNCRSLKHCTIYLLSRLYYVLFKTRAAVLYQHRKATAESFRSDKAWTASVLNGFKNDHWPKNLSAEEIQVKI